MGDCIGNLLLTILAIFLPPVVALIKVGCTAHFFINILLTLLAFIPGCIHALWLVWSNRTA